MSTTAKKGKQAAEGTSKKEGFTAEERAAMKARAKELKSKEDGESAVRRRDRRDVHTGSRHRRAASHDHHGERPGSLAEDLVRDARVRAFAKPSDDSNRQYAAVPAAYLAPKPRRLTHVESAALALAGLSAWQGLVEHGGLREGERVRVLGASGGVGHLAVQLARGRVAAADKACDLVFDTVGGELLAAAVGSTPRVVSVAEEAEGATYFVVEPNRAQLAELARLADADELVPAIDSVFPLEEAGT